jgi:hypothetical protein
MRGRAATLSDETEQSLADPGRQAELRRLAGPADLGGARPRAIAAATPPAGISDPRSDTSPILAAATGRAR